MYTVIASRLYRDNAFSSLDNVIGTNEELGPAEVTDWCMITQLIIFKPSSILPALKALTSSQCISCHCELVRALSRNQLNEMFVVHVCKIQ